MKKMFEERPAFPNTITNFDNNHTIVVDPEGRWKYKGFNIALHLWVTNPDSILFKEDYKENQRMIYSGITLEPQHIRRDVYFNEMADVRANNDDWYAVLVSTCITGYTIPIYIDSLVWGEEQCIQDIVSYTSYESVKLFDSFPDAMKGIVKFVQYFRENVDSLLNDLVESAIGWEDSGISYIEKLTGEEIVE